MHQVPGTPLPGVHTRRSSSPEWLHNAIRLLRSRRKPNAPHASGFFSLAKRLRRPALSDSALFLFFLCFFSVRVEESINPLPPSYMTYTSSRVFWSFHTSDRVSSLMKATAIASLPLVLLHHGDRTALPYHRGRPLEARSRFMSIFSSKVLSCSAKYPH